MKNKRWIDNGIEPKNPPNPKYPNGIRLDVSRGADKVCDIELEYPARRCGHWIVECTECGLRVSCTTAGRADDPRSIKVACKVTLQ